MLKLGSTYIIVKDVTKSKSFYCKLLNMEPTSENYDRWIQYDFNGQCIALWNPKYDEILINSGKKLKDIYCNEYIKYKNKTNIRYGNNMVLNFYVDDLKEEYNRIQKLNIGKITSIMYLNVASPYHFFILEDPDGNTIEIAGNYKEI